MTAATDADKTLATLQDDIAALKRDVTSLVSHLQRDATTGAQNAAAQIDDGAHRLYRKLASTGERSLKEVGRQVEGQPVMALLLALGLGYISGRLLSR